MTWTITSILAIYDGQDWLIEYSGYCGQLTLPAKPSPRTILSRLRQGYLHPATRGKLTSYQHPSGSWVVCCRYSGQPIFDLTPIDHHV